MALLTTPRRWTLLIAVVGSVVFLPTLWHGFVFDDGVEVVNNGYVRSLTNLPHIWSSNTWGGAGLDNHSYRPLTITTFALNHSVGGLAPWGFHLVNVVLHALTCILMFSVAVRWGLRPVAAALGALLFAVHPIHVEAVANVAGRKELLTAALVFAALLAHSRALRSGGGWLALAPVAFAAAMFCKETGVVTLGLLALQDATLRRGEWRAATPGRRFLLYGLHGAALLLYLAARWQVVGGLEVGTIPFYDNPAAHASTDVRVMTAIAVVGRGLCQLLVPIALSPDYSFDAVPLVSSAGDPWFLATAIGLGGLTAVAIATRSTRPLWLFALAWYGLTLLPASNLIVPIGTIYGERLLYLPSVAVCAGAGHLLAGGLSRTRRSLAVVVVTGLVALLGGRAMFYAARWANEVDLFTTATQVVPRSTKAHLKLGDALSERGLIADALAAYERALTIAPDNYKATLGKASALEKSGDASEAEMIRRSVVATRPDDADVRHGMGVFLRRQGALGAAAEQWRHALSVDRMHAASLEDLGSYHFTRGDHERAEALWTRATVAAPGRPIVWYNLGTLYERTGRPARANNAWRRFLATAGDAFPRERAAVRSKLGGG